MKKKLIVFLVCANAGLLVALVLGSAIPAADAQVVGGGADYMMVTGHIGSDWDGVFVIDLAKRRMLMWYFDKTNKRLLPYRGVDFVTDFRGGKVAP